MGRGQQLIPAKRCTLLIGALISALVSTGTYASSLGLYAENRHDHAILYLTSFHYHNM